ncbi:uncharacterized protein LOC142804040 isoform X2 [Rhipicephalus microplus]|uniref:uncharacterized protein LOC142804040 isoform X2 n=1 Tax=Rhipicephalus microplus TaxID=6941 RepID=UPI003F6BAD16
MADRCMCFVGTGIDAVRGGQFIRCLNEVLTVRHIACDEGAAIQSKKEASRYWTVEDAIASSGSSTCRQSGTAQKRPPTSE